jgi:hypothetical protein
MGNQRFSRLKAVSNPTTLAIEVEHPSFLCIFLKFQNVLRNNMHTKHFSHDLPMYQITLFFSLSDHPCPRIETSQRHTASQMEGAAVDNRSSSWSNRRKCWLARSIVWYQNLAMCEMDVGMGQHLWMTAQHISKYAMS